MAGSMIAHSMLLGGPGFPCLHPAVFHSIACTSLDAEDFPSAEDIPRNAATFDLLEIISKVRMNTIITVPYCHHADRSFFSTTEKALAPLYSFYNVAIYLVHSKVNESESLPIRTRISQTMGFEPTLVHYVHSVCVCVLPL